MTKTFFAGEVLTASDVNEFLAGLGLRQVIYYTSSGTFVKANYPWLRAIRVRCQGGGGGGATRSAEANSSGAGGTGGSYAESFITDIAGLDASVTVTRGGGGAGAGTVTADGGLGVASSFGSLVVGAGTLQGSGGDLAGLPGTSTGDLIFVGQTGQNGARSISLPGGAGGSSHLGGGGRGGRSDPAGGAGVAGGQYGGGGGGSSRANNAGAGADGIVIVELYG